MVGLSRRSRLCKKNTVKMTKGTGIDQNGSNPQLFIYKYSGVAYSNSTFLYLIVSIETSILHCRYSAVYVCLRYQALTIMSVEPGKN